MKAINVYAAGLFDGEGCVTIRKDTRVSKRGGSISYQLICILGMSHKPTIDFLQFCYGGSVTVRDKGKHKTCYQWTVASEKALVFLYQIYPHSITKKNEIQIAIDFQENVRAYRKLFGNGKFHPDREAVLGMREHMFLSIKDLKH